MTEALDYRDLLAERFGAPTIVTQICCLNCGGLLIPNTAGFWVHLESGLCSRPTFDITEVAK